MKIKWIVFVWCLVAYWFSSLNAHGFTLEGQSKGSTNWIGQNLQNWKELEYIPIRISLTGGPVSNQVAVVSFDHSKGATPGLQDLTSFVASSNVVLKSAVLSAPAGSDSWSYTFTVDLKDSNVGTIQLFTRMSAGAHLFVGSSLSLFPSLQVHKPGPAPGSPDLAVIKSGPAHAAIGQTITYTILYTNVSSPFNTAATGVQVSDELPAWVTYVPGSATGGGVFSGNILTWDLGGLAVGQGGTLTYQVVVSSSAVVGQTFQNVARVFSAEDDANTANNESKFTTIVDPAIITNATPVAVNDVFSIVEDGILAVVAPGVLSNDTDADGDPLTAYLLTVPSHGAVVLNTNGSFVYTPVGNYFGSDSFTYNVSDGKTNSSPATVNITVTPVNDPPVAVGDSYVTDEDVALSIAAPGVLGNDSDIEGDLLSAIVITPPSHGTLSLSSDGSFIYTPATNFNGTDSFTYAANDGATNSGAATVTITVNPKNDAPVAVDDNYNVNEDTTLIVSAPGVLTNDSDVDGDALSVILVAPPTHGSLTFNTNGSFTYVPATNYNGTDSFTYQANDGTTNSGVATVTITVMAVNDAPVAVDDSYVTAEDVVLNVPASGVLTNDTDVDGNILRAILVTGPSHGTLSLSTNGSFSYKPATNYNGTDTFTYKANDGLTNSAPATVTITVTPVNDRPTALNDTYNTPEDVSLSVAAPGVLGNDSDVDGDPISAVLVTSPAHGTLTFNTDGSFSYVPNTNYNGTDSFTYRATDGITNSAVATVSIVVAPVNDAPVALDDHYTTPEDVALNIAAPGVLVNDTDVDGDNLRAILVTSPAHGTLSLNTNGSFVYTPTLTFNGSDSFTYKASDGKTNSGVATVTISVSSVNDAPVAVNDSYSTDEDTALSITAPGVLGNDTDVDGDSLLAILGTPPAHGTLTLNANGSFTYTPALNFNGSDSFTYKANDGVTNSAAATVTILVKAKNDPPTFTFGVGSYVVNEDAGSQTVPNCATNISAGAADESGQLLTFTVANDNTALFSSQPALTPAGTLTFTPAPNAFGTSIVTAVLRDNGGTNNGGFDTSVAHTFSIVVNPVNDAPSFTKGLDQLINQVATNQTVTNWATDISVGPANETGQNVSFVLTNDNPSLFIGQPQIDTNGTLIYTPAATNGVAHVSAVIHDDGGTDNGGVDSSLPQEFLITINGPPVAKIIAPTNGSVIIASTLLTVLCNATDPDGTVTNLALFCNGTLVSNLTQPYICPLPNLPPGAYQLTARATDNLGLTGDATPVNFTVINQVPISVLVAMHFNPQTGLFEQTVQIGNPTPNTLPGVRIFAANLTNGAALYNANGSSNGISYVQYNYPIPPGQSGSMIIEYYVPSRITPNPVLTTELVPPAPGTYVTGAQAKIDRVTMLSDGTALLDFQTLSNRCYYVQYSRDLKTWQTVTPCMTGTGSRMQWLDNGPPKTEAKPCNKPFCVYRVLLMP